MAAMSKGAGYYDTLYRKRIEQPNEQSDSWEQELDFAIASLIVGSSVLDLGCGTGHITSLLLPGVSYHGTDFSEVAIEVARATCTHPNATFQCGDVRKMSFIRQQYDTVLLIEVLEHVTFASDLAQLALGLARQRVIVTVPVDMPGRAHVKAQWNEQDLRDLFGPLVACQKFGGPHADRWWLAIVNHVEMGGE